MKRQLAGVLLAGVMIAPAAFAPTASAQGPAPMSGQPLTGTPPGVEPQKGANTTGFALQQVEGQPIETRTPEKVDDKPAFPGQTRAPYRASVGYNTTVLTDKLNKPWSMAFLPSGKILVTEKIGNFRTLDKAGVVSDPIMGTPAVVGGGQVGLLDVALAPDFARSRRLYFSFSEPVGADNSGIAIASATLNAADTALSDVKVIFRTTPALPKTLSANQGGRIAIGADGYLYITIGDRSKSPPWDVAQKPDTNLGKIIRITSEGKPAPGNPFIGKAGTMPEIWSMGHRSEEGLAFAPDGSLWESEHGPRGGDELNKINAGKNYGWPLAVHGIDYPGPAINGGITAKPGIEQPRYYWDPVIAPSGLAFYTGTKFPRWRNSVFVGALRGMMLDRLTLSGDKVVSEEPLLVDRKMRVRDVRMGPDGDVYVLGDTGTLLKITPK
jgi:glucose/arabinose dehydrogenase